MGRSKFPGKPSKHVNRTRINVLPTPTTTTTVGDSNVETGSDLKKADDASKDSDKILCSNNNIKERLVRQKRKISNKCNSAKRKKLIKAASNRSKKLQCVKATARRSVRSFSSIQKMGTKTKHSSLKEGGNLVGKFVLPSRSIHSSRVIKPNKRFINVDSDTRTFKQRVINKRKIMKTEENAIVESAKKDDHVDKIDKTDNRTSCTNPKLILRQARLKLQNQNQTGPEGPFSSGSSNNSNPPGTVTCGVCGAVRFYRFVKQARKFNIYSCESCRKFISKMMKRQSNKNFSTTLVCHKGQGMCHVPPIVRSQQWKLIRCAYRARCPACWLKMCLRSFQMPASLKQSLMQLLPKNMQIGDSLFTSSLPLLSWQSAVESKNEENNTEPISSENDSNRIRPRSIRLKTIKNECKVTVVPPSQEIKRQKLDLKGPRVKHVCRSASIVLGQPLATFPDNKKNELELPKISNKIEDTKIEPKPQEYTETTEDKENKVCSTTDNKNENVPVVKPLLPKPDSSLNISKREKLNKTLSSHLNYTESKLIKKSNDGTTISIDFWEAYDPEEVGSTGFSLIGSEPFPMQAICFLCGSAGKEALLHCSLCCEPYHPYCLEQFPTNINNTFRLNWLCPRCTTCHGCGKVDKQKIDCQKCHKTYHPECFNVKWNLEDKPTVCSNCLKCRSCNTENITKFVGNLALCVNCFKLRNKGNFCPLCQKCYDDNDVNTKMMECNQCNKWIHAKCEGLLDDHYEVLSLLPDSIKFLCHLCSTQSTPHWRKAVQSELRSNFNSVLRIFGKNQTVRNLLKWSSVTPANTNNFMSSARKIQFGETDETPDETASNDLIYTADADVKPDTLKTESKVLRRNLSRDGVDNTPSELSTPSKTPVSPVMLHIKNKINSNEYISLKEFNNGMEEALKDVSTDLLEIYRSIIRKVFPWYDPLKQTNLEESNLPETTTVEKINYDVNKSPTYEYRRNFPANNDTRMCSLCKSLGDGIPQEEGRLLYSGQNEWIHANCALWSAEVYEEIDGSLQNVQSALSRSRSIRCANCKHKGASVGCCFKGCYETYHFKCALQASCYFLHDKTVYCSIHDVADQNSIVTNSNDFAIRRPVYIELDKKRKKYSEPNKINIMIGSLCVTNLGKIVPVLSDSIDAIIPTGFTCSRLFWSTEEPWKLIPYVIKTSVHNAHNNNAFVDRNFTIDHSLPKLTLEKTLKDLFSWQKELEKERTDQYEFEEEEEPQNAADILSPELTDAIFDELQHDLLDGISVQDMLNSYEELLNMDFKASEINCNENVNLSINIEQKKENDYECELEKSKELKRSKSEILSQLGGVDKVSKVKNHQRSCSLTWSCKLDNSLAPVNKKRKIVPRENNMYFQLLQVDGACDSSGSECGSPTHETENIWSSIKDEPVTCEKCQRTYRTVASYQRHLETCEAMLTSESDSDETLSKPRIVDVNTSDNASVLLTVAETEPRLITAYESYSTYQATQNELHSTVLNTQTFLTTESTSEVVTVPETTNMFYHPAFQPVMEPKTISTMNGCQPSIAINQPTQITLNQSTINLNQTNSCNQDSIALTPATSSYCVNQQPLGVNQTAFSLNQSSMISVENAQTPTITLHQPITINQGAISVSSSINPTVEIQPQVTIQSVPFTHEITPILNIAPSNQITIDAKMLTTTPNLVNSVVAQTVVPQNTWIKPIMKPVITQKAIRARTKPRLAAKRPSIQSADTVMVSQTGTANPSMILHPIQQTNIMPRFLESFQQQGGQNVQYVATLAPQINSPIQPQTQLLQLQSDNNFLSIVPGVQPTTMFIQPRVVQDQLLLDSSGSVVWATQPVQPVYYGFETIVQNTVLQSSQFLPTAMPGVLTTNSSYSATTQVFQTSKLEPVLDVTQGSIVLLNSGQIINQQLPQSITQNIQNHVATTVPVQSAKQNTWKFVESNTLPENILNNHNTSLTPIIQPSIKPATMPIVSSSNSITLPIAPFVQEQGIPTNIVTPTPKPPTSVQSRPMSRVLPMQTTNLRDNKKIIEPKPSPPHPEKENVITNDHKREIEVKTEKVIITENFLLNKEASEIILNEKIDNLKTEPSLKLVLHKQNQDGLYKIGNNYASKASSVPIAPLKPIKPKLENLKELAEVKIEAILLPPSNTTNEEKEQSKVSKEVISLPPENKSLAKTEMQNSTTLFYTVETQDGFRFSSTSLNELWNKIFETVQSARLAHNMAPLPENSLHTINNLQLLGLKSNGLKYLIEQLPGANKCMKYKPSFHIPVNYDDLEDDTSINHSYGCVKFIPYIRKKEPNDMFGWLASKHRQVENSLIDSDLLPRRGSVTNLPMAMRFRQLKEISKTSVGVYRSIIHRRGLFALKDIEAGEMVIEYAGEVIRSILTDKREKYYNSKGIGCYMFRVDDNFVVDATMKGNAARFINHSCDPNCFSKVVEIHGHKHIIIFALRKILCGEELTYDYKFPFEEDKIPCTCGAKKCRKFLN